MQPSSNVAEVGHVVCGGLQLNCHGLTEMLLGERVEYAWLMQFQINKITAALSTAQVCWGLVYCCRNLVILSTADGGRSLAADCGPASCGCG